MKLVDTTIAVDHLRGLAPATRLLSDLVAAGEIVYLIAATALVLEADLLTTNVRHFPMIEDLRPPY